MSIKILIVAAGLVAGATTAAFAQDGWKGVAGPGTPAYGPGCYACPPGTGGAIYDQAIPRARCWIMPGRRPVSFMARGPTPRETLSTPAATIFGSVRMGLAAATTPIGALGAVKATTS